MNLSAGQLLGGAGIVANRQRQAEDAMLQQRQTLMQIQEANRLQEIRSRMGEGAVDAANAPLMQFGQTPGLSFGTPSAPAPAAAPTAAPTANAPTAQAPTRPVVQPSNRAPTAPAAPAAPAAVLRTPDQLANVPTDQLTAAEFQALSPQARLQRLQNLNRDRQAALDRTQLGKAPAAAADVFAGGPYNAIAGGLTTAANALGVPRIGRALGIYDADVTRVEIPKVGTGSATPYYDMVRQAEQANQPLNEAQLLERLKTGETTRAKAAEAERAKNITTAQKEGYADWQLDAKGKPVRGLINNNPGNIRPDKAYTWQGSTGQAGGFVQFASPEAGIRALTLNLLSYNQQGINTVQSIISRWAPESDKNKTGSYINQVSQALGVKPTDTLNLQDAAIMRQLVNSIIKVENGKNPYDARTIDTGIALGFNREAPVATAGVTTPAAPGTSAAPPQSITQAVATGTPTDVATAAANAIPVQPAQGGTMYGPAQLDASARNPQIQQALTTRAALQRQVALFNQYGMGDKAWEAVSKIQALDLGLYKNQADIGVYEGATTGNFSRAMSVLSTFTGSPHQVLGRNDGKFDLYINGKVARAGLDGSQVEQLVRTQVDSEYRQQLAKLQTERGTKEFESNLKIREKTSEEVLRTAREIQVEVIKGNTKVAEEKLKLAGFKLIGSGAGDGKAYYSNGLGDVFMIDGQTKTATINGTTVDLGVNAQRVSGVDRSIWSTVNAPQQEVR